MQGLADVTSGFLMPDFLRDERKYATSCAGCGAPDPVRIEGRTCSECASYPTCGICNRWIGDGSGWLPGYVNTLDDSDEPIKVCLHCYRWGSDA